MTISRQDTASNLQSHVAEGNRSAVKGSLDGISVELHLQMYVKHAGAKIPNLECLSSVSLCDPQLD